jgi:hypothetical protein
MTRRTAWVLSGTITTLAAALIVTIGGIAGQFGFTSPQTRAATQQAVSATSAGDDGEETEHVRFDEEDEGDDDDGYAGNWRGEDDENEEGEG